MPNEFIVGAWRKGLADPTVIRDLEERRAKGFRLLPYASTVVELVDLLDSYEALVAELTSKGKKKSETT